MLYRSTTKFFLADVFDAFEMLDNSVTLELELKLPSAWKVHMKFLQQKKLLRWYAEKCSCCATLRKILRFLSVYVMINPELLPGLSATLARVDARKWELKNFHSRLCSLEGTYPLSGYFLQPSLTFLVTFIFCYFFLIFWNCFSSGFLYHST